MKKIKQHDVYDCATACLASVATHYGLYLSLASIRMSLGTVGPVCLSALYDAARQLGFQAEAVTSSYDLLPKAVFPAIAAIHTTEGRDHYVVITKAGKISITLMDPADGRFHRLNRDKFCAQWRGVLLLLLPALSISPQQRQKSILRTFLTVLYPERARIALALFLTGSYTLLSFAAAWLVQILTDRALPGGNEQYINRLFFFFATALVFQLTAGILKNRLVLRVGRTIDHSLIHRYYHHLFHLPAAFYNSYTDTELLSRIGDAVKVRQLIVDGLVQFSTPFFIFIGSLLILAFGQLQLLGLLLFSSAVYAAIYTFSHRLHYRSQQELIESEVRLDQQLMESIAHMKEIRQLELSTLHLLKNEDKLAGVLIRQHQASRIKLFSDAAHEFIAQALTFTILYMGSILIMQHRLSLGEMLAYYTISALFSRSAIQMGGFSQLYQQAHVAAERFLDILQAPEQEKPGETLVCPESIADICFDRVTFGYPSGQPILQHLSFRIEAGESVVITGASGAGKSTLFQLLLKQCMPHSGTIRMGIHPLAMVSQYTLSRLVAVVPQQCSLFEGSLKDNLCPGETSPDLLRLVALCHRLALMPFIESLSAGFDSPVGKNGCLLSGGQRQSILIARALYRQPSILLLDEPTSALDEAAEQKVYECLLTAKQEGTTILLISHSPKSLKLADRLFHLHQGKMYERTDLTEHSNTMVSPLSPPEPAAESHGGASGLIQNPLKI